MRSRDLKVTSECDSPAALESSSGGCTPVRQLKKRAAQRRNGSMPFFTLSAKDLPDTSWISLKERMTGKKEEEERNTVFNV